MKVHEIFTSIQGESTDAGLPCVFVRLFGCNVGCVFCDQDQSKITPTTMSIAEVIASVRRAGVENVCITRGEPMLQWDNFYPLVLELVSMGNLVSIETSGCVKIDPDNYNRSFKYVMDIKCPSSGVSQKNILDNLMNLQAKDEVKYVISNREDYLFARQVIRNYPTSAKHLFSPCFDENWKPLIGKELIDWIIKDRLRVRVQIQMHKCLGVQ